MARDKAVVLDVAQEMKEAERAVKEYEKDIAEGKSETEVELENIELAQTKRFAKHRGDVQQVMKSVEARRFIWRILSLGGPYQSTFVPGAPDVSDFNEGKRYVTLEVLKIIMDADPGIYLQMQREYASDLKSEAERRKKEQGEINAY